MEYLGHTVNFKTHRKSYKIKKKVQTLRQNRRRMQKCEELNPFSGMVYCADYGAKMYLNRWHDIEVHAPDKSSGHRQQKVDIYFRFKITAASAVISRKDYVK